MVSLKQKFFDLMLRYYKRSELLDKLEEAADQHAIEFAEWVLNRSLGESGLVLKDDTLDKFKREKGYGNSNATND